jgi:hypothetical protein
MAIIVTDIVKEYGAYYINAGQNMDRLKRLLMFGRETTKIARQIKTSDTVYRLAESNITSLVQPFQKTWTPKGAITFVPNPIELFKMKVDLDIYPDDIEDNWLGFLASENQNRKEWPLIRYIMEQHLIQKIEEDLELKLYYKGVHQTPVAGTPGNTETSMNGLLLHLKNNEKVNRLDMDPLEASTIYDQLEEAFEQVAEVYQNMPMLICVAPKWRRAFLKDKRAQGYYDISDAKQIDDTLDFSPAKVKGLPSMIGTDDLFITPNQNMLHLTKKGQNAATFRVEESKRCVSIMTDWWEGLGFGLNEVVWTNVAAAAVEP